MPLLLALAAGIGWGAFGGSQVDDAIETATGERATAGLPTFQLLLLAAGGLFVYRMWNR